MSLGFYFNQERCVGCKACQVACKDRLDLQKAGARPRRVTHFEVGKFPSVDFVHTSIGCNHCERPACVANCPTGAMFKDEETGIVLHNDEACIGCKTCVNSCPYEAPQYDDVQSLIVKCDSCKALRDSGANPVCVDACAMRALDFGDISELSEKYGEGLVREAVGLPSASDTDPNVLVAPRRVGDDGDVREIAL